MHVTHVRWDQDGIRHARAFRESGRRRRILVWNNGHIWRGQYCRSFDTKITNISAAETQRTRAGHIFQAGNLGTGSVGVISQRSRVFKNPRLLPRRGRGLGSSGLAPGGAGWVPSCVSSSSSLYSSGTNIQRNELLRQAQVRRLVLCLKLQRTRVVSAIRSFLWSQED